MAKKFSSFYDEVARNLSQNGQVEVLNEKFKLLVTDQERVSIILRTDVVGHVLDKYHGHGRPSSKSSALSEKLRIEGNSLFKQRKFAQALDRYTESVLYANCDAGNFDECLSLALANRSAVLFHLKDFQGALEDSERSLSSGYPDKLKYKLIERVGKCYMKQGNSQLAKTSFKQAIVSLALADLPTDKRNQIALECYELEKHCNDYEILKDENCKINGETDAPANEKMDTNTVYPCATTAFSIVSDPLLGRHAVATRDIQAGELILFEKPYSAILFERYRLTHCHHCLKRCRTMIGCPKCSFVGFCNERCKDEALAIYHTFECPYLSEFYKADLGLGQLALRMITTAGFQYLYDLSDTDLVESNGLNAEGIYDSLDYKSVHSLIGHSESRTISDLFRRTLMAVFILRFIECDKFFTTSTDEKAKFEKKVCIGAHILKQLQMLPCNAHEVSELHIDKTSVADSELKEIGSAIYATLSLLNHSCDPTVVRHSYGNSCALRAIKFIPKGGLVIDNYGALYAVNGYEERQQIVGSQYFFNCQCEPCINNWPLYPEISADLPLFKCPACSKEIEDEAYQLHEKLCCKPCGITLPISKAHFNASRSDFNAAMGRVLAGGKPEENLPHLLKHLTLICQTVKLPWQEHNNCQEIVKQCFSMLANHTLMQ